MPPSKIRNASLQYWPRKRAAKIVSSPNWKALGKSLIKQGKKEVGLDGFLGYKVGMISIYLKDMTPDSMSKNKKIIVPATVVECPKMKIFSVRFYKNKNILSEKIVSWDKELKSRLKKPKNIGKFEAPAEYDDIRVLAYPVLKDFIKKNADIVEIALTGSKEEKLKWIHERITKEISVTDVFKDGVVDTRAVTKGFGLSGPVKRFGISLKAHKSEKGVRRPGSLGPWHPAHVIFKTPVSGQHGFFTRTSYNNLIVKIGNAKNSGDDINEVRKGGWRHYGFVSGDYVLLKGSVPGPERRPIVITFPLRPTRSTTKQKFEFIEAR